MLCGLPLCEYDHLDPYSQVHEHDPDNLVLLCPGHHAEKTKGFLSYEAVAEANENPRNRQTGESFPFGLRYGGGHCEAIIGGSRHVWPDLEDGVITMPLLVDDTPIVAFRAEDERLLLTVQLFNEDNELLVQVVDNELVFSADQWDVEFVGRELTVRHAPREIFVAIKFDPPGRVVLERAHIWRNGVELDITPQRTLIVNNNCVIAGGSAERCQVGLGVGDLPEGLGGAIFMDCGPRAPYDENAGTEDRVIKIAVEPQDYNHDALIQDFKNFLDDASADDFNI